MTHLNTPLKKCNTTSHRYRNFQNTQLSPAGWKESWVDKCCHKCVQQSNIHKDATGGESSSRTWPARLRKSRPLPPQPAARSTWAERSPVELSLAHFQRMNTCNSRPYSWAPTERERDRETETDRRTHSFTCSFIHNTKPRPKHRLTPNS